MSALYTLSLRYHFASKPLYTFFKVASIGNTSCPLPESPSSKRLNPAIVLPGAGTNAAPVCSSHSSQAASRCPASSVIAERLSPRAERRFTMGSNEDFDMDARDNAALTPRCVVVDDAFD